MNLFLHMKVQLKVYQKVHKGWAPSCNKQTNSHVQVQAAEAGSQDMEDTGDFSRRLGELARRQEEEERQDQEGPGNSRGQDDTIQYSEKTQSNKLTGNLDKDSSSRTRSSSPSDIISAVQTSFLLLQEQREAKEDKEPDQENSKDDI